MIALLAQVKSLGSFESPTKDTYGQNAATDPAGDLEILISNMIGLITVVAGVLFIVYFIWGAVDWITAGGDSGKVSNARNKMVQGAIGLIVIVAAYSLVGLIGSVVGIDVLNFAEQINNIKP